MQNTNNNTNSYSPFVVFGASKSGTTWLQKLLNTHPDVCCHFQRLIFPIRGTLRDQLLQSSRISLSSGQSPFGGVFESEEAEQKYVLARQYVFDMELLQQNYLRETHSGLSSAELAAVEFYHQAAIRGLVQNLLCHDSDKAIIGTKAFTDIDQLFRFFPQAKLVHIIRDGRDVAVSKRFHSKRTGTYFWGDEKNSILKTINQFKFGCRVTRALNRRMGWFGPKWYQEPGEDGAPLLCPEFLEKSAREWANIVSYIESKRTEKPTNIITVKYEELKTDAAKALGRVLEFLNADSSSDVVDSILEKNTFEKQAKKGGFFRKGISGDWRNHFTDRDVALFKQCTGDTLTKTNYESSPNWNLNQ